MITFKWFTEVDCEAIELEHLSWVGLALSVAAQRKRVLRHLHRTRYGTI